MKLSLQLIPIGLLSLLVVATPPAQAESVATATPATVPTTPPDLALTIERNSGVCPNSISLWTDSRFYEGGGEISALVDTTAIAAAPAQFMDSQDRVVIYGAPLQARYASCVGWVVSEEFPQYNIWLQFGNVYFRFDLDSIPGRPMSAITYQDIVEGRPYVRWAIAD
jgi:hypothetical protein